MLGLGKRRVGVDDASRPGTRAEQQTLVIGQARVLEVTEPRLLSADELPLLAQLEVDLSELEAVVVARQRVEARRVPRAAEQAEAGMLTAADATSMPTSMTVVATSTSASPAENAAIAACFSRWAI